MNRIDLPDLREALLAEQFAAPVPEWRGPVTGPQFEHQCAQRWEELEALGDSPEVLHNEFVRLRAAGVPADQVPDVVAEGERQFQAQIAREAVA